MFGIALVGTPGSGKSTACVGFQEFYSALGRKVGVVNLDPAVVFLGYEPVVDIRDLIRVEDVMIAYNLGPNGALLYCFEFILKNSQWLLEKLQGLQLEFVLFDCPGQAELFTIHACFKQLLHFINDNNLCVLNFIDSTLISNPNTYISTLLQSLQTMLQLSLPQLNVLSKFDLLSVQLPLPLSFYTEVQSLDHLLQFMPESRLTKMNNLISELVEEYGLVGYRILSIEKKRSVVNLLRSVDACLGLGTDVDYLGYYSDIQDEEEEYLARVEANVQFN